MVKEYLHAINNLARYALEFVNTDAKKIASFQRGLSPKMLKTMGTGTRATFNAYMSYCLTQENNNNNYSASKSRKRAFEAGSSQSRAPMVGRQQYHPLAPCAQVSTSAEKKHRTSNSAKAVQGCSDSSKAKGQSSYNTCCQHHVQGSVLQLPEDGALCQ